MPKRFSERKGLKTARQVLQTGGMDDNLRNSLWNVLDLCIWSREGFLFRQYGEAEIEHFTVRLWMNYFKRPVDKRPERHARKLEEIRTHFFSCEWHEVYDFLEFVVELEEDENLTNAINHMLERELAGYRIVSGLVTDITDEQEIAALETALEDNDFPGVKAHLQRALELLSDRDTPDYRNSIKESISAVESLAREITRKRKATFGDALKILEQSTPLHPALKEAFSKLYGYASDKGGIRHAMLEEPDLGSSDAKFFLLSCTSFINYVKAKLS